MDALTGPERLQAWLTLVQTHTLVARALNDTLERSFGLSRSQAEVLTRLSQAPEGRLRMSDLARLMMVSKSEVTRLVDRLEQTGNLRRELAASDRRSTFATLTEAGQRTVEATRPVLQQVLAERFVGHLTDADVRDLLRGFKKVLDGNGEWDEIRSCPESPVGDHRQTSGQ
ncbi:MAG: MarR family transcriptional regulator [Actinobacteria bacterium]|nr:MarR family transcriptional regulator [Actinomycetota bacterium]MBI3687759.1 MarR family transcriptional regulator [Actinomycetota bacterium]